LGAVAGTFFDQEGLGPSLSSTTVAGSPQTIQLEVMPVERRLFEILMEIENAIAVAEFDLGRRLTIDERVCLLAYVVELLRWKESRMKVAA